jgi:hypothetical protein
MSETEIHTNVKATGQAVGCAGELMAQAALLLRG